MSMQPVGTTSQFVSPLQTTGKQNSLVTNSHPRKSPAKININQIPTTTGGYAKYVLKQNWDTKTGKAMFSWLGLGVGAATAMMGHRAFKLGITRDFKNFPWKKYLKSTADITIPSALQLIPLAMMTFSCIKAGKEVTAQLQARNISNPTIADLYALPYFQQHKYMKFCLDNAIKLNNFFDRDNELYGLWYLPTQAMNKSAQLTGFRVN